MEALRKLVVYFSATGTTRNTAKQLAEATGADLWEIQPVQPYTEADLAYRNGGCRVNLEQNGLAPLPEIANGYPDFSQYDLIFLGSPTWWGTAPKIMIAFLQGADLRGKQLAPFTTSGGSPASGVARSEKPAAPEADWLPARRFAISDTQRDMKQWLDYLKLEKYN
jgi:flavodoxin